VGCYIAHVRRGPIYLHGNPMGEASIEEGIRLQRFPSAKNNLYDPRNASASRWSWLAQCSKTLFGIPVSTVNAGVGLIGTERRDVVEGIVLKGY
jgi:hypothetical protein